MEALSNMNTYVVAFHSNFDGTMQMEEVLANSALEAGKKFLLDNEDAEPDTMRQCPDMESLEQYVFDTDHAIGVYEIKKNWKKYTTVAGQPVLHQ